VIWVYLIAAGAIIGGALFAVHSYNSAIEDAAKAKAETVAVTKAKNDELKKIGGERDGWIVVAAERAAEALRQEQVIRERETERARLQKERDDARTNLSALLQRPDVKPWANTELPLAVVDRLRGTADGGVAPAAGAAKAGAPARESGGGDGASGIRGVDKR
jgi:hypothetical protein